MDKFLALLGAARDSVLHTALLGVQAFIFYLLTGDAFASFLIAGWTIFLRELTQKQTNSYEDDFFSGWDFWHWSFDKNLETWVPILAGLVAGIFFERAF